MPLFLWNKSYEINIQKIDEQHRRLEKIIYKLKMAGNFAGLLFCLHVVECSITTYPGDVQLEWPSLVISNKKAETFHCGSIHGRDSRQSEAMVSGCK